MKFPISNPVRLTDLKSIVTKPQEAKDGKPAKEGGKEMNFATIVNTTTYEVLTTILALADGQSITDIVEQRDYMAVVEYDGKWGSVTLTPAASAGFPTAPVSKAKP